MALFKKNKNDDNQAVKKAAKPKKQRRSLIVYFKEVIAELKKVTWPSRKELVSYSVVVTVFIIIMAGVLFLMDTLFGSLLNLIL